MDAPAENSNLLKREYLRLITFKKHHGNICVPSKGTEDMKLGKWGAECGMKEKPINRQGSNF